MNNKTLFIIFALLLGVFLLTQLLDSDKRTKSFDNELIAVDTSKVSSILLYPKVDNFQEIKLEKTGSTWTVSQNGKSYAADQSAIESIMPGLVETKVKRLVARSKDKWEQYEVTDSLGTRVKVLGGSKTLADFMVGKFNFQQQPQSITSFVRRTKEDDIFAVDGFLSMTYNRGLDAWRNKLFTNLNPDNITRLTFNTPEGTQVFQQLAGQWSAGDKTLDSLGIATYLRTFKNLKVQQFGQAVDTPAKYTLNIEGNNMSPVTVQCFAGIEEGQYILSSSAAPGMWAVSDENGFYKRIFKDGLSLN